MGKFILGLKSGRDKMATEDLQEVSKNIQNGHLQSRIKTFSWHVGLKNIYPSVTQKEYKGYVPQKQEIIEGKKIKDGIQDTGHQTQVRDKRTTQEDGEGKCQDEPQGGGCKAISPDWRRSNSPKKFLQKDIINKIVSSQVLVRDLGKLKKVYSWMRDAYIEKKNISRENK